MKIRLTLFQKNGAIHVAHGRVLMLRRTLGYWGLGILLPIQSVAGTPNHIGVRRIGFLAAGPQYSAEAELTLSSPLRLLGWIEGQNLQIERRYASSLDRLKPLADELVLEKVEIIVTDGPGPTQAAMRATTSIPIVFRIANDALGAGLVTSLARPSANVTGFSVSSPETMLKLLSLGADMIPGFQRVGLLENSNNPQFVRIKEQFRAACQDLRLEPIFVSISSASNIYGAVKQLALKRAQALALTADSLISVNAREIISTSLNHGIPTLTVAAGFVEEYGALASYSYTSSEANRRAAYYVDRILNGAKIADLPVEQPTEFALVVNQKTARRLGLIMPRAILLRADSVVE